MLKRLIIIASVIMVICLAIGFPVCQGHAMSRQLEQAIERRNYTLAVTLLEKGANPNVRDSIGYTPLHKAVICGQDDLVRLLLEKGADASAKGYFGYTPLHLAINRYFRDANDTPCAETTIAKMLIRHGADLNAKNSSGFSPLFVACLIRCPEFVKLLLESGADVKMRAGRAGRETTLLYPAVIFGSTDIVELLLEHGIETNVINDRGETALDIAINRGCEDIAEILKKHGAKTGAQQNSEPRRRAGDG